jgi:prepilin-type N-terminal cleavage/methylation domain-containing protein
MDMNIFSHFFPVPKPRHPHSISGFTLIEVLTALVAAGLLTAMIAAVLSRGLTASSALEDISKQQRTRAVIYKLLSMDIRSMLPDTELTITEQGFSLESCHNHLLPGPLPVTVTWSFSDETLIRREEKPELNYSRAMTVASDLENWKLAFFDLSENRWVELKSWLQPPERPAPAGLQLHLYRKHLGLMEFVHRLPLQPDILR